MKRRLQNNEDRSRVESDLRIQLSNIDPNIPDLVSKKHHPPVITLNLFFTNYTNYIYIYSIILNYHTNTYV